MSELILLVARGVRWTEGCGRLVRECHSIKSSRISLRYIASVTCSELSCSAPLTPGTKLRQSASRGSMGWLLSRPREYFCPSVLLSHEIRGPWRAACSVPRHDRIEDQHGAITGNCDPNENYTAQASLHLQKLLGIRTDEADLCAKKYRSFAVFDPEDIPRNYKLCLDAGMSQETVRQNVDILSNPVNILKAKIQLIKRLNVPSIDDAVPFLKVGLPRLLLLSNKIQHENDVYRGENRIIYLAEQLQCSVLSACEVVARHYFMQTVSFSKLRKVLKIMMDFHVTKDDILNDAWAFRYNPDVITERLKRVTAAGVYPVKPWMVRCPELALSKRIGKEICRRSVLGDQGTIVDYLSRRFECDRKTIIALIEKTPKIGHVSGPKLKQVVDFLLENGFTIEDVIKAPKVFFRRLETMQEWLKELQKYKHRPKKLLVFVKSKKQYNTYLETIKLRCSQTDSK